MNPAEMPGPAPSRNEKVMATQRFSELYFGYASNLAPTALKGRCPDSLFCGLALLKNFRWQINETGYANIVSSDDPSDVVYGSLSFLSPRDEAGLDESEGVPWMYEKQWHDVERIDETGKGTGQVVKCMTYVDVQRTQNGKIMRDYVVWILRAAREGMQLGIPEEWVEKALRPWVPVELWGNAEEEEASRHMEFIRMIAPRNRPVPGLT